MPQYYEKRLVPYTCQQMFQLVMDVPSYPQFLPWCQGARVLRRTPSEMLATLKVGYKALSEEYTSLIQFTEGTQIKVTQHQGPFKKLLNQWHFLPLENEKCELIFEIDFEFRSKVFQSLITVVFEKAAQTMVQAFEKRAGTLYKQSL